MPAENLNLTIEVGAKYSKLLTWQNVAGVAINTSLYTAEMQIRSKLTSSTVLLTLKSVAPGAADGSITLSGADGGILLEIGADVTDDITWGIGVYDLELKLISDATNIVRLIEGQIRSCGNVTRP